MPGVLIRMKYANLGNHTPDDKDERSWNMDG